MIEFKPTRRKHSSGYRQIWISDGIKEGECSDVICLELPDKTEIRMDSANGEIRLFSNYYDFEIYGEICSDCWIKAKKKYKGANQ